MAVKNRREMKEVRKMDEQIEMIIRKHPHMENHIVRTPFGPRVKPSWAGELEKIGAEVQTGKDVNKYRRKARAVENKSNGRDATDSEVNAWLLTQDGLRENGGH